MQIKVPCNQWSLSMHSWGFQLFSLWEVGEDFFAFFPCHVPYLFL
jgi:hypothetical protein